VSPRVCVAACTCCISALWIAVSPSTGFATDHCVGAGRGCAPTVQAAIDSARDGDTITVGSGTFAGGLSITKSLRIEGAGPGAGPLATRIRGGGPVVTIGDPSTTSQPAVALAGMTITGGVTHGDGVRAAGGGIYLPPGAGQSPGAAVTLSHIVVTGNRAEPTTSVPSPGHASCPAGPCPFALGAGGGIASFGSLRIADSVIRGNQITGPASDAQGGGIYSSGGELTLFRTVLAGNRATAVPPVGRHAEGGGMFVEGGLLTIRDTQVSHNIADLTSDLPSSAGGATIDIGANSGGIGAGDDTPTTIADTLITGNTATARDPDGEPLAFDSALLVGDSSLTMRRTVISGNRTAQDSGTTTDSGPGGSALELDGGGTIADSRIAHNLSTGTSDHGVAGVNGAVAILNFNNDAKLVTMHDTVIADNTTIASSRSGSATVEGAGIFNGSLLELRRVQVDNNRGVVNAPAGLAQGGGVWNSDAVFGPPAHLTIDLSALTGNVLRAGRGITVQGGGLFTTLPVAITHTVIARNEPDQCSGC
jgi:hypothetical protein